MQWIGKISCFFGFHQWVTIREEWVLYRQKETYLENQDYMKEGENIVSIIYCPCCNKRVNIKVQK